MMPHKESSQEAELKAHWQFGDQDDLPDDPLLACLILMSKMHHNPTSAEAFTAGLPLENNRLTPELFVRAAQRADMEAEVTERKMEDITNLVLPALLILKKGKACLLLEINEDQTAVYIQPDEGSQVQTAPLDSLEKAYEGTIIFVKDIFHFTERAEETVKKDNTRHWFWSAIHDAIPTYSEVLLASFLINIFALAVPLFIMNVYDRVVPNNATETLWVLAIGVCFVFIFDFILRTLRGYFIDMAGKNVDVRMSARIFEQILGVKMGSRPKSVGAFVNTVQSFESFREFITSTTVTVLVDLPFVLLYILIIGMIGGNLALIPAILLPVVLFISYLIQIPLTKLTKESYKHAAEKQATLIESIGGAETIKSVRAEGTMQRRWEQVLRLAALLGIKLRTISNASSNISVLAQQLGTVCIVILGVYKISNGDITTGALIACTILSSRALAPMAQVASIITRYHQSAHSLEAVDGIMKLPTDRTHGKHYLHRGKLGGDIEFKNVSFSYPDEPIPALRNINLKIKRGEKVAILGRVGSGKTTLVKLMNGLFEPTEGTVMVDQTDIQQIDPADLRHSMGCVPQDVTLFFGTVKDNIMVGAPYVDDALVLSAAKMAGVESFTAPHPAGFDMQVGERGTNLSGGQRQMIAVARAMLTDPPVLLLDEPSASMDDGSEAMLRQNLASYIVGRTMVLVTHKHAMLSMVDRIILVEHGMIVADGPKEAVIRALNEGKVKKKPGE